LTKASPRKKVLTTIITSILACSVFLNIQPASATESDWSKPRPSRYRDFNETLGEASSDGIASLGMGVTIGEYVEDSSSHDNNDYLGLKVSVSANSRGWIEYYWGDPLYGYSWVEATQPTLLAIMMERGYSCMTTFFFTVWNTTKYGCAATALYA